MLWTMVISRVELLLAAAGKLATRGLSARKSLEALRAGAGESASGGGDDHGEGAVGVDGVGAAGDGDGGVGAVGGMAGGDVASTVEGDGADAVAAGGVAVEGDGRRSRRGRRWRRRRRGRRQGERSGCAVVAVGEDEEVFGGAHGSEVQVVAAGDGQEAGRGEVQMPAGVSELPLRWLTWPPVMKPESSHLEGALGVEAGEGPGIVEVIGEEGGEEGAGFKGFELQALAIGAGRT